MIVILKPDVVKEIRCTWDEYKRDEQEGIIADGKFTKDSGVRITETTWVNIEGVEATVYGDNKRKKK